MDTYPVRVRLPAEPLMLVDRIMEVEGEKGSLTHGRVITEHDVLEGAWYLDGGRTPVCITVEAGQADLFLSSYLGIDLRVKGERSYRLLDATVEFHRDLPQPGETISVRHPHSAVRAAGRNISVLLRIRRHDRGRTSADDAEWLRRVFYERGDCEFGRVDFDGRGAGARAGESGCDMARDRADERGRSV
ncbi:MAG: hypothetical protein IPK83_01985 [Planctomycetes bacterium]|nr:hypothetical protein [Planctomycetota bacterium]